MAGKTFVGERAMVFGKAGALSVLLMSLSNQLSFTTGVDYFNGTSFLALLVVAVVLVALLRALRRASVRLALSVVTCTLTLAWAVLLVYLQAAPLTGGTAPEAFFVLYAFVGRVATLFVNIQWNYQFVLNSVDENPRRIAAAVLGALALFLLYVIVDGFFGQVLVMAVLATSVGLATRVALAELRGQTGERGPEKVLEADSAHPAATEGVATVRLLYFGSRVLYGLALGVLVWLATLAPTAHVAAPSLAAAALLLAALGSVGASAGLLTARGSDAAVISLPVCALALLWTAFYPEVVSAPLCLFAALAETTWTTQNLFQLPSYRRICRLHAAPFAYGDYAAQIVPYYLAVWALSSSDAVALYLQAQGVALETAGAACLALLMAFSVGATIRHAVRYLPSRPPTQGSGPLPLREADLMDRARQLDVLTPRERDVFALMAAGYSRSYIGKVLYISPDTVKVHARHIYAKLGIASKDDLIRFAEGCPETPGAGVRA